MKLRKCAMCGSVCVGHTEVGTVACYNCGQQSPIRSRRRDARRIWNAQQALITQAKEAKLNPDYAR